MVDFAALDPQTRSWALVGFFLQGWASMEANLHRALAKALGLDPVQMAIVTSNIQLRDKIHILRTAVSLSAIYPESDKERFSDTLVDIANYSHNRNMMAHDFFGPADDGDGVSFLVTKARGELKFPDTVWTTSKFIAEAATVNQLAQALKELEERLHKADLLKLFGAALQSPHSSEGLFGLSPLTLRSLRPPENHSSDTSPASSETDAETPPAPEGK